MREQRIRIKYKKCKFRKKLFNVILKNEQQKFFWKKHNNVENDDNHYCPNRGKHKVTPPASEDMVIGQYEGDNIFRIQSQNL